MFRWFIRLVIVTGVVVAGCWLWNHFLIPDETRIRRLITTMKDAVIQHNLLRLSDAVAQDYSDDFGLDKSALLGVARSFREQYDELIIEIPELAVAVEADHRTAHAAMRVHAYGHRKNGGESEPVDDQLRLFFRKTDDGWKLTRIEAPELKAD